MDFLRRLFGGGASASPADDGLYLYVRCNNCQSPLRVRIDPRNELSPEFDEGEGVGGYILRKEMMDSKCFRLMYATLRFDTRRRENTHYGRAVILRLLLALLFVAVALRIYLSRRRDPRPLSEWLSIAAFLCVAASMLLSRLSPPFSLALGIVGVLILIGAQVLAGFLKVRR
jgi:hypothetical protein